jgi:hypothetical protein
MPANLGSDRKGVLENKYSFANRGVKGACSLAGFGAAPHKKE